MSVGTGLTPRGGARQGWSDRAAFVSKVTHLLGASAPRTFILASAVGVATGVASAAAIAIVHGVLRRGSAPSRGEFVWFAVLCVSAPILRAMAHRLILKRSLDAMTEFVTDLTRRIVATPLRRLEAIGSHRILSALTEDMTALNLAVTSLPTLLTNCTLVVACTAYLAWLEPWAAVLFLLITGAAMWTTLSVLRRSGHAQRRARGEVDTLFGHFRDHLDGIKELQLSGARRHGLFSDLQATASAYAGQQLTASSAVAAAVGMFQVIFLLPVGLFVFAAALMSAEAAARVGEYAVVLLYAMAPVNAVGGLAQNLSRGAAALENIDRLDLSFGEAIVGKPNSAPAGPAVGWTQLLARGVVHRFGAEAGHPVFTLGPVDLIFDRGETVFVVGGNGSGKTTFTKLLCGLYMPDEGEVRFDVHVGGQAPLEAHRAEFSAVYSDYHLFRRLPAADPRSTAETQRYLQELGLAHKVSIVEGRFSTLSLSQGQRKRLALASSLAEDRNVYIFDEWAADQDQAWRAYFYEVLLIGLRTRGKTVFVVSHDERYFDTATRIVKFEFGRVVSDTRPVPALAATAAG